MSRKRNVHYVMCRSNTEENRNRYESMKNKGKKKASREIRKKSEKGFIALKNFLNELFTVVRE